MIKRALAVAGAAGLLTIGLAATPAQAGVSDKYDLIVNGGSVETSVDIGDVTVIDNNDGTADVKIEVLGSFDPENVGTDTRLYSVAIDTGCEADGYPLTRQGNPIPGRYKEFKETYPDGTKLVEATVDLDTSCDAVERTISVHADAKQNGNIAGYQEFVDATGPVKFKVATDPGNDPDASYFDTTFIDGPLAGQSFDGYCIDIGNTISPGATYTGELVSIFDYINEGNVDKPENLAAVLWLVNNYSPGDEITVTRPDLTTFQRVLSSGDIQRAIWYLVDNTQSTSGLGNYNDLAAKQLAAEALTHNEFPTSVECGTLLPLILVIDGQTTIGQTTFALIDVPCETLSGTAMAMDTSVIENEGGDDRYGHQFPGDNWFSYVHVKPFVGAEGE